MTRAEWDAAKTKLIQSGYAEHLASDICIVLYGGRPEVPVPDQEFGNTWRTTAHARGDYITFHCTQAPGESVDVDAEDFPKLIAWMNKVYEVKAQNDS